MSRGEPLIRQWNLLKAMQAVHYGLSADDLATRLECSKRQVLRDLKILQELGFPVSFEERDFGKRYWKLSAHFIESDKLVFSLTELISVYLSQKLLAPLVGTQFGEGLASLLDKIKAMLSPGPCGISVIWTRPCWSKPPSCPTMPPTTKPSAC